MAGIATGGDLGRLRAAALIEWAKGGFVAIAASGLFALAPPQTLRLSRALLDRFHFAGRGEAEAIFVRLVDEALRERLFFAALAAAYVLLRFIEGAGLWLGRAWARWLGIVSCIAYLVVEAWHFAHAPTGLMAGTIALTLVLLALLWPRRADSPFLHRRGGR